MTILNKFWALQSVYIANNTATSDADRTKDDTLYSSERSGQTQDINFYKCNNKIKLINLD